MLVAVVIFPPLSEEITLRVRSVYRRVAYRTVLRSQASLVMRSARQITVKLDVEDIRVTFETKLSYRAPLQHLRV